tara:strand:- start:4449 stop:4622 length:174 start_codon:yes stop_codon:yes gene_type:complete
MHLVSRDKQMKATASAGMYTFQSCESLVDASGVENFKKTQKKISKVKKSFKKNDFFF